MRELLLLRHGMTEHNERRVFTGAQDVPLSPRGRAQLEETRSLYPKASRYFTSGMLRTVQTLALLYGEVPHTDVPDLAEYRLGDFEGRGHAELYANEAAYRAWLQENAQDAVCPGGETRRAFSARVHRGWYSLMEERWQGLAVLVTHGGVLRCLLEREGVANGCGFLASLTDEGRIIRAEAFP